MYKIITLIKIKFLIYIEYDGNRMLFTIAPTIT
nr:MAG TPA: hypothetical protein [Caudoviricetes sp.]